MKFSNFVSTLAVVFLAFNVGAISKLKRHPDWENTKVEGYDMSWFFRNADYWEIKVLDHYETKDICKYGIDVMIKGKI